LINDQSTKNLDCLGYPLSTLARGKGSKEAIPLTTEMNLKWINGFYL
jgi:hypothetical protein